MRTKRLQKNQSGVAVLELVLVLVVVGLIAGTGWWVIKQKGENDKITGDTLTSNDAQTKLKASSTASTKEPAKTTGKTTTEITKTSVDNILSGADAESSIDDSSASAAIKDATSAVSDTSSVGDSVNASNF